jgi:hypothetical protein
MEELKYKDPENTDEIVKKIFDSPTLKEIEEIINEIFPGWIVCFVGRYSTDYKHLENNWSEILKNSSVSKKMIMMVDFMNENENDENYRLINMFASIYIMSGFAVRTKYEITSCSVCNAALPTESVFNKIKEKNLPLSIEKWDSKCSTC